MLPDGDEADEWMDCQQRLRAKIAWIRSPNSAAAWRFAFQEASLRGARLHALHAWSMPYSFGPASQGASDPDEVLSRHRRDLEERVASLREEYRDVEVAEELVREAPVPALARASDRSDLLVVGSRGRGGFHGLALGSVCRYLLHYSACPIAVVRPRTRSASL
ncbi:universal stress protein [Actinacidiphila glaucinigra]|uniref:universal stress protein n=1 Tax=Actinacidiphila glaucinigra TaxID=235986 RepID=UPI003D8FA6C3